MRYSGPATLALAVSLSGLAWQANAQNFDHNRFIGPATCQDPYCVQNYYPDWYWRSFEAGPANPYCQTDLAIVGWDVVSVIRGSFSGTYTFRLAATIRNEGTTAYRNETSYAQVWFIERSTREYFQGGFVNYLPPGGDTHYDINVIVRDWYPYGFNSDYEVVIIHPPWVNADGNPANDDCNPRNDAWDGRNAIRSLEISARLLGRLY
jgi:hypothetical protein